MRVSRVALRAWFLLAVAAGVAGCAARRGVGEIRWPLDGTLGSGYGRRAAGNHGGYDILAPKGTEVLAAGDGTVAFAGDSLRGYGNAVVLSHGGGIETLYGHLMEICVKSGDVVRRGEVIGRVGKSGNATTYHLHFEVRENGRAVDPAIYLPGKVDAR